MGGYLYKFQSWLELEKELECRFRGFTVGRFQLGPSSQTCTSSSWTRVGSRVGTELASSWATVKHPITISKKRFPNRRYECCDFALSSSYFLLDSELATCYAIVLSLK